MKKQVKTLTLCRETLHHLATKLPLREVQGATGGPYACTAYISCTNCYLCH